MQINEKVILFRDMVGCCHNLYLWIYDCAMHLLESNCSEQETMNNLLQISIEERSFLTELSNQNTPMLVTNAMDMVWLVLPLMENQDLIRIYVLGPLFLDDISPQRVEEQLIQHGMPMALRKEMLRFLKELPVIAWSRVQEYSIMLQYCVTGNKINVSDIRFYLCTPTTSGKDSITVRQDNHGTYQAEQEMLRMVREGDLRLKDHIDQMAVTGSVGKLSNGDPMRQVKNTILVCTTLFSRAAIEGGLNPELSYTLTDRYFQAVEASNSYSELNELTRTMQADFVQRVHNYRMSQYSHAVQLCCDYITLHLDEDITLKQLAELTGYATYYISKKFKKETGKTPADYIRLQRLERAAYLLRTTQDDVQTIGIHLQFGSQSYFSESFRKEYGISPTEYRQKNR